jgi:predicted ribosomally synthesized peptide with nif11-like leader
MSHIELTRLLGDLQRDPERMEAVRGLGRDAAAIARWARQRGYAVEAEELDDLIAGDRELSDEDLEQAAGGDDTWTSGSGSTGSTGGGTGG